MTNIEVTKCDDCGYVQYSTNPHDENDVLYVFECKKCKNHYCENCQDIHANEELWE